VVPEQNGKQSRKTENQRKGEEIPLLPKKIDVDVMKELHRFLPLTFLDFVILKFCNLNSVETRFSITKLQNYPITNFPKC
jgi:hypothetical protein